MELDAAYQMLPAALRFTVEKAAGHPIYSWYVDVRDGALLYAAVGPAGFCAAWGQQGQREPIADPLRRAIEPANSRWFVESAPSPRGDRGLRRATRPASSGPFDHLDPLFTETFGLLPERTQAFFQEPSAAHPFVTANSFWHAGWRGNTMTFQAWCFAAGEESVSFAHGRKQITLPGNLPWDFVQRALAKVPMKTHATWWARPKVTQAPAIAYTTLGVVPGAPDAEIRARYRALVKQWHPDVASGSRFEVARRFHQIQQAWQAIGSPAARARYDASLTRTRALPISIGRAGWWRAETGDRSLRQRASEAFSRSRPPTAKA